MRVQVRASRLENRKLRDLAGEILAHVVRTQ
jgi:hypothetical protein